MGMRNFLLLLLTAFLCVGCAQKPLNADNPGRTIVAFGDSLTAGYGAADGESFPARLQTMVNMPVINLGVSGDTARAGADRKREIARHNPFMVLIEFGGNDLMRGRPFAETQTALEEIVDYVHSLGAIAVLVDTGGNFKMAPYSKMMKQLAQDKGALFVPAIMDGIFYKPQYKSDGIHPNAEGYRLIAGKVYKKISPFLR